MLHIACSTRIPTITGNPREFLSRSKTLFNQRFQRRLEGEESPPENPQEKKIFGLVGLIERQIDRAQNPAGLPKPFDDLTCSTRQRALMKKDASPYEIDILGLSFNKGATSVIADGYLIAGDLTSEQLRLLVHFGAFTQLWDDLEDLQEGSARRTADDIHPDCTALAARLDHKPHFPFRPGVAGADQDISTPGKC